MRLITLLSSILMLVACGATGTPEPPVTNGTSANDARTADRAAPAPPSRARATPPVQRHARDDRGEPSADLPDAIVRALGTDERVLACPGGTRADVSQFKVDWVGVRRIDLNQDGRKDWIVNGLHACLRTSYAAYWWIYADSADGPRVVLRAEPAATLEVLSSSTQGFRDLRMHLADGRGAALVAESHYDGTVYASAASQ